MLIRSKNYNYEVKYPIGTAEAEKAHRLFEQNLKAYDATKNYNITNSNVNWTTNSYLDDNLSKVLRSGDFTIINNE